MQKEIHNLFYSWEMRYLKEDISPISINAYLFNSLEQDITGREKFKLLYKTKMVVQSLLMMC